MLTETPEFARRIVSQLGGMGKLKVMLGVSQVSYSVSEWKLNLRIRAKAKRNIKLVSIQLCADDTYTVRFYSVRGFDTKLVSTREGVYCDNLKSIVEQELGLYLSL